jgi:hypothetical protein
MLPSYHTHRDNQLDLDVERLEGRSDMDRDYVRRETQTFPTAKEALSQQKAKEFFLPIQSLVQHERDEVVGLKTAANYFEERATLRRRAFLDAARYPRDPSSVNVIPTALKKAPVEELEDHVRATQIKNPLLLLVLGFVAAFKVMFVYLINLETILSCGVSVGLTLYWYDYGTTHEGWNGGGMNYVILAFAVTSPIAAAIGMAFTRRERALESIADFRSFAHQLYIAHSLWDWPENGGRQGSQMDIRAHSDSVMAQIVCIGDELARFLTLPTTSRSIHRMTSLGRTEAAATVEVAYRLLESITSHRIARLCVYGERIKAAGLSAGEVSRIRQYERWLESSVERLRMIKMYRTPQAFRSFARIFTFVLPPFYAPTYAQVAIDTHSLGMGVAFGIVTAVCLTALFECLQVLEDPFVGYLTLDGIDVQEEFQVLLWTSLVSTRRGIFPDAPPYPVHRRRAIEVLHENPEHNDAGKNDSNDGASRQECPPSIVVLGSTGSRALLSNEKGDGSMLSMQSSTTGGSGGETLVTRNRSNDCSDDGENRSRPSPIQLGAKHISESIEFGFPWDGSVPDDLGNRYVRGGIQESRLMRGGESTKDISRRGNEPTAALSRSSEGSALGPSHRRTLTK